MKKILFLCRDETLIAEHVDAALACSVMGLEVGITLPNNQKTADNEKLAMLALYGVKDIYIEETNLQNLAENQHAITGAQLITDTQLQKLFLQYDHTIQL
ncbi:MAG: hypothetical protein ACRBBW_05915 [Cellvibrionaceae bacterium]